MEEKSIETKIIDGVKQTFYKGQRHSFEDKPAVDGPEVKMWYNNGIKHRVNGPAMIYKDNSKYYYYEGHKSNSLEEHLIYMETHGIVVEEPKSDNWFKKMWNYLFK